MPKGPNNTVGLALDTTNVVLTTLKDAARLAPVPYLQEAANVAIGILDAIQGVRDNKDAFRRLADDACGLVYAAILCTNANSGTGMISRSLLDNLRELAETLIKIERIAKKKSSRNKITAFITNRSDRTTIQEYRETLRQSLDQFGLKSTITIQENIAHLMKQQNTMLMELRERERRETERMATTPEPQRPEAAGFGDWVRQSMAGHVPDSPGAALQRQHMFPFQQPMASPYIQSPIITSIGDMNNSHHITNTNSGNTTTTITENSNNRIYDGTRQRRGGR